MPEDNTTKDQRHFIAKEFRPDAGRSAFETPPVVPDATKEEMRRRANEVLGGRLKGGIPLGHPFPTLPEGTEPTSIIRINSDVQWTMLDGEAVLLNLETGYYYSLNRMASVIWEMCTQGDTVDLRDVRGAICQRFEVTEDVAIRDIALLMNNLREEGMIEPVCTE